MTRLIDADALETECYLGADVVHKEWLDNAPTIDAIPIEWIIRQRNKHNNDGFAWIFEAVLDDWRSEHGKAD